MRTYLATFIIASVIAALITPLVCRLAFVFGWLDEPDQERKVHERPIPRVGGVAVVIAFFAPILGLSIHNNPVSELLYSDIRLVVGLCLGAFAILALGVYDDIKGADAKLKLTVQSLTALGMWLVGFQIDLVQNPFGTPFEAGVFSLPLTMLWIVGVVNAMNLIDGLDGLASGVAVLASVVLFGVSFSNGNTLLCLIDLALAGSLVGFLLWNFNPARIFLGDSGSMFLGFILSTVSVWTQQKSTTAVAILIPVIALGLPLLDTTLSVVRRVGRGQSPFMADREHLHHRLLALGLSHRSAVLTLYVTSVVFGLAALAMLDDSAMRRTIALSTAGVVTVILLRRVGVLSKLFSFSAPNLSLPSRDEVRTTIRAIRSSSSREAAWSELARLVSGMHADAVRLTWVRETESGDRRASVFFWRRDSEVRWPLDRAEVHPRGRVVRLESAGNPIGELVVVFRRGLDLNSDPWIALSLELLGEALLEQRLAEEFVPSEKLVPLKPALRVQPAAAQ